MLELELKMYKEDTRPDIKELYAIMNVLQVRTFELTEKLEELIMAVKG
jgi:hypothetical protein